MAKRNLRKLIGATLMVAGIVSIHLLSIEAISPGLVVLVFALFILGGMLFVS